MKISEIFTYFTDTIFRRDINEWRNPVIRWLVQQYRLLFYTARGLLEHGTIVRSAALTFYTLMSLVPIVAVVFAVVKGFGLADGLIDNLYALFPQNPEIIDYVVGFAEKALARTQGGVVAAVALVMLFWAIIRVFGSIESAFNNIWEVNIIRKTKPLGHYGRLRKAYLEIWVDMPQNSLLPDNSDEWSLCKVRKLAPSL